MLKTPIQIALIAILSVNLIGCATPEQRQRRQAQRAREDAQWEAERRQRDREDARREGQRDAEDFQDYLVGYARSLGKSVSQLTPAERADARREYDRGGYGRGYGYHHGYGYWW